MAKKKTATKVAPTPSSAPPAMPSAALPFHVASMYIDGFRGFEAFNLALNPHLNIIVGDNECGKSSLLEALHLVLTGQINGRHIAYEIDPYLFNCHQVAKFFAQHKAGTKPAPPRILVEVYFHDDGTSLAAQFKGTNNSRTTDVPGISLTVKLDSASAADFDKYMSAPDAPQLLPIEYYDVEWQSFKGETINPRHLPFRPTVIDATSRSDRYSPHRYIANEATGLLSASQQQTLSLTYRKLRHSFVSQTEVSVINTHLKAKHGAITSKVLSVAMDMSSRSRWDAHIAAHLDDLPFAVAGKGEQCRVQMKLAIDDASDAAILLIEEPENHLSHSNLAKLIDEIGQRALGKQIVVTTHSSFVLNKLGLDRVKILSRGKSPLVLSSLTPSTLSYFKKLPGYDTLRLILSPRCILVEGPSDELIVQKAYFALHDKMPLENGVDVISIGSLAFKRFLEIAKILDLDVRVVRDNDGKSKKVQDAFAEFIGPAPTRIAIHVDPDDSCKTLEPHFYKVNSLAVLNEVFDTTLKTKDEMLEYMTGHKTECALQIFSSTRPLGYPQYILDAIQ